MRSTEGMRHVLIGQGIAFDTTNKVEFGEIQEARITFETENIELVKGDSAGKYYLPVSQDVSLKLKFLTINPRGLVSLTGGSVSYDGGISLKRESKTIISSDAVLSETPSGQGEMKVVGKGTGKGYVWVSSFTINGHFQFTHTAEGSTVIHFNSAEDTIVDLTYPYVNTTGAAVTIAPDDLPRTFAMYISTKFASPIATGSNAFKDCIIYLKRVRRTSGFDFGGDTGKNAPFGFDAHADNLIDGDIVIYFND
ncbi:MAG: hypothetical protein JXA60_03280 [Candidatus Coatesbacteria bacterium]|nr:hypothetical protein [Candidatus Coatesbacteria bacterium]